MNYSGEDTKLQIGLESAWGTAVAPTVELDMIDEEFGGEIIENTEPTLVGNATAGRTDIMGHKVPGGFSMLVKPDNIGLLLACALGTEAAPAAAEATSTVYDHAFTLLTGSATTLPFFTAVVDKKADVRGYISNKVSSLAFNLANNDYLQAKVSTIGRQEAADGLESLTLSTLRAFSFNDMQVLIDDVVVDEITSFDGTLNNNLEDDLFVADGSAYMIEVDRQRREFTVEMEALYNNDIETLRTGKYQTATAVKLEIILTGDTAGASLPYSLTILCENAYFTQLKPMISGPERMRVPLSLRAASIGSTEPLTVTLRDLQGTAYS